MVWLDLQLGEVIVLATICGRGVLFLENDQKYLDQAQCKQHTMSCLRIMRRLLWGDQDRTWSMGAAGNTLEACRIKLLEVLEGVGNYWYCGITIYQGGGVTLKLNLFMPPFGPISRRELNLLNYGCWF